MITLEVNGTQYGGFTGAQVQLRLDALSNTFSFDATSNAGTAFPFKGGDACRIFVDDELVLTGNIELVTASYDNTNHSITFEGRDKTGDILDSSLGGKGADGIPISDMKAPITLATICKRVISHIGSDVEVVDEVKPAAFKASEFIASAEPGEGAFEFLEKYSRLRQVLLSSNADGNLLLTASSGEEIAAVVSHRVGNPDGSNNVIRADVSYDSTGRYNLYKTFSQLNTSSGALAGFLSAVSVSSSDGKDATDEGVRAGRQLILISESPISGKDIPNRSTWEKNIRRARGRVYSAELSGFRDQSGNLWTLNTLPLVLDEFAGIENRMLVNTISFSNSHDAGTEKTVLGLIEKNAYTLELQEPTEKEGETTGGIFG